MADCDTVVKNVRQVVLNMWTGPRAKLEHRADYSISRIGQFANKIRTKPSELGHYLEGRIKKCGFPTEAVSTFATAPMFTGKCTGLVILANPRREPFK
jgi:hypothetical protein